MFQGRSLNQAPSPRLHVESPVSRRQPFNSGQTSRRGCVESSHNGAYGNRSLGRSIAADQRDKFIKLSSVEQVVVVGGRYNWWCKLITRPPFSLPVAWGSTPTATKTSTRTTTATATHQPTSMGESSSPISVSADRRSLNSIVPSPLLSNIPKSCNSYRGRMRREGEEGEGCVEDGRSEEMPRGQTRGDFNPAAPLPHKIDPHVRLPRRRRLGSETATTPGKKPPRFRPPGPC